MPPPQIRSMVISGCHRFAEERGGRGHAVLRSDGGDPVGAAAEDRLVVDPKQKFLPPPGKRGSLAGAAAADPAARSAPSHTVWSRCSAIIGRL